MAMPDERISEIGEMADIRLDDYRNSSTRQNASIGHSAEDALLDQSDAVPSTATSWFSLFTFTTLNHFGILTLALLLTLISGLVIPGMSILLGKIFGSFAGFGSGLLEPQEFMAEVGQYSMYLAILGAIGWVFNGTFFATWIWFGELQAGTARKRIFDRLVEKELSWYAERKDGVLSLATNCQTQIQELQVALSQPLAYTVQALVTILASLTIAFYNSWRLTLVILATLPVILPLVALLSRKTQPHLERQKTHLGSASKTASCAIVSIDTVKTFNGQDQEHSAFVKDVVQSGEAYRGFARIFAMRNGFVRFMSFVMFVQGFWYGSQLVRKGEGDGATEVMTTFWCCLMATQSLELIMPQMGFLEKGRAAGAALNSLLGNSKRIHNGNGVERCEGQMPGQHPEFCSGHIRIEDLSYAYPSRPTINVLSGVTLDAPPGQLIFIVGESGCGKSTLANLIAGVHQAKAGSVAIDDYQIESLDPDWVKKHVSIISQQSMLFNETLFRNVAFGRKDYRNVTEGEVLTACERCCLFGTLVNLSTSLNLSDGLQAPVGVGGRQFSGGQLQRIALAREYMRGSTILILDEALSSLDIHTKKRALKILRQWRNEKTTIVITHSIEEILPEDFVYVMDGGQVVQQGLRTKLDREPGVWRLFVDEMKGNGDEGYEHPGFEINSRGEIEYHDSELDSSDENRGSLIGSRRNFSDTSTGLDHIFEISGLSALPGRRSSALTRPFSVLEPLIPATPVEKTEARRFWYNMKGENKTAASLPLIRILRTIWPSLSTRLKVWMIVGCLAAFLHAAGTPAFSFVLARLLGSILDARVHQSESMKWSVIILGLAVIDGINCYLMFFLFESCAQAWVETLRCESFRRILSQPREWFDEAENSVVELTEALEEHGEEMKNLLARFVAYTLVGVSLITMGVIWSFYCSWRLTIVGISVAPIMYGISAWMSRSCDLWEGRCKENATSAVTVLHDVVTSMPTVKNLSLEGYFRTKYYHLANEGLRMGKKRSIWAGIGFGLTDSSILFATALVFYYGSVLVGRKHEDLADIVTVFTMMLFSLSSVSSLVGLIPQVSNSKDSATRLISLSQLPIVSHETAGTEGSPTKLLPITFSSIFFKYSSRPTLVLEDVDFILQPHTSTAITGVSGCGKSTILQLLIRMYQPSSGHITISNDGAMLEDISVRYLRERIALVPQNPVLFDCSIGDNIAYGLYPPPSYEDILHAARLAGVDVFVCSLPAGYSTMLSAGGGGLSSGQKQRVAIARALVRKPELLVLDECTSGLDAHNVALVAEVIEGIVKEKLCTVLMVTHSIELMRIAQRCVLLGPNGAIEEEGTYHNLWSYNMEFRNLVNRTWGRGTGRV